MSVYSIASEEYRVAMNVANPRHWHWMPVPAAELLSNGRREQIKEGLFCLVHEAYANSKLGIKEDSPQWATAFGHIAKRIRSEKPFQELCPTTAIVYGMSGKEVLDAVIRHITQAIELRGSTYEVYCEVLDDLTEAILKSAEIIEQ